MKMSENPSKISESPPPKGRLLWGGGIFIFGFLCPLFVPLVTASNLSTGWKAVISGLLMVGMPEIFMIIAVAILGKPGFNYLKGRLFAFLKRHATPDTVSRNRYRAGLAMFALPLLAGWLLPYVSHLIPAYEQSRQLINVTGDLILVASFFILGGDFWDKVRALFVYGAKAQFPLLRTTQQQTEKGI
jgi:hypothetical protein